MIRERRNMYPLLQSLTRGGNRSLMMPVGNLFKPIYTFDFSSPVTQDLSLAGIESATGATMTAFYDCQEASGDMLDQVGSENLTPANSPLQGQGFYGIDDGSGITARKAVEITGNGDHFISADANFMDCGTSEKICGIAVFRQPRASLSNSASIVFKNAGGVGYIVRLLTTGAVRLNIDDGTNSDNITVNGSHDDGAPHWVAFKIDYENNTAHLWTDLGSDTGDITGWATMENSSKFHLGNSSGSFVAQHQVTMLALARDAECDNITQAKLNTWWTHGGDPTGLLTTKTRTCSFGVPVASDKIAYYHGSAASVQLPIGYHSALPGNGFGLAVNDDDVNLLSDSMDLTAWSDIGSPTTNALQIDSPTGCRDADTITTNGANEGKELNAVTVAETEYTFSFWVYLVSGTATGVIEIYDATGATSLATDAFTATAGWTLVSLTATTNTGQISTDCRFTVDTSGDEIGFYGMQLNEGQSRCGEIRTEGAPATLTRPDYISTEKIPVALGRVDADFVIYNREDNSDRRFWGTESNSDARLFYLRPPAVSATNWQLRAQARDDGGSGWMDSTVKDSSAVVGTLYQTVFRWDIDAGDIPEDASYTALAHVLPSDSVSDTSTSSASEVTRDLYLHHFSATGDRAHCYIQSIVIYDEPGGGPS